MARKLAPRRPPTYDNRVESDEAPKRTVPRRKAGASTDGLPVATRAVAAFDDNRKLSKKDQERLAAWRGPNKGKLLDTFFRRQAEQGRKEFGHKSVFVGDETQNLVIGIPCPALAFEFVIAQDCFPLGLVLHLVAKTGVGKSGLLAEFGRWFDAAGGGMVTCENETKFNPDWYRSIMTPSVYDRMLLHRCKSVEDWQRHLTFAINRMKRGLLGDKKNPGPGRTVPVLYGVDSIMGKQSEEIQEKILGKIGVDGERGTTGEGHASRGFPIEAQVITRYMRTIPQEIDEWPFALVLINHLKMKTDDMGNQERHKAGGEQVNFQESFELELGKLGGHKKKIECADFEGFPVFISCEKNSFGPTHRRIHTRVLWWEEEDPATGHWQQRTIWDWDWSTVHLLFNILKGEKANPRLKAALKESDFHLECPATSDVENRAWSKTLGMTDKDQLTWTEVGAMIRENTEVMDRLRHALRINRRPLLHGDYMKQKERLAADMP